MDALGDVNGDGVVDIALNHGHPLPFYMWGESLGGITSMVLGGLDPAFTAVAPVSGGAGLTDVALRSTVEGVAGGVIAPLLGPIIVAIPASERAPVGGATRTACQSHEMSVRWVVQDVNSIGELEIGCTQLGGQGVIAPGDDVVAYNYSTGQERCAGVTSDGRFFLPVPADQGDRIALTVFHGNVVTDYGTCARNDSSVVRGQIRTYTTSEGDCAQSCGHVPPNAVPGSLAVMNGVHHGDTLTSPVSGLGLRRQTSEFRRFIQLAQAGIDPGDPVNYAPLFFLRPRTNNPHPVLAMTTVGDTDVPLATGNSFARAAGLLPFIHGATGSSLDEYVAADSIWNRYARTPDGVLVDHYVIEGLSRLNRFPVPMGAGYLFDADDLDDGRQPFGEISLSPPLRLVRGAQPVRDPNAPLVDMATAAGQIATTWQPAPGLPLASFVNAYIVPQGVHTFYPSDPSLPWDVGAYLGNLVARFFQSNGTDVQFYTNPTGHQCLENASCAFIPAP
jgi:hypothetical protein